MVIASRTACLSRDTSSLGCRDRFSHGGPEDDARRPLRAVGGGGDRDFDGDGGRTACCCCDCAAGGIPERPPGFSRPPGGLCDRDCPLLVLHLTFPSTASAVAASRNDPFVSPLNP